MSRPLARNTMARRVKQNARGVNREQRKPEWRTANFELKVYGDSEIAAVGNGALIMYIPEDLIGADLVDVSAAVSTPDSGGDIEIMIRNATSTNDMLSTPITIPQGDFTSFTAGTQPVIDDTTSRVFRGDMISVDIDNPGTDAMGLMVVLVFG